MNSIKVTIFGKSYPLRVLPGEEKIMEDIAGFVDDRFKAFKKELGNHSEQTVMVLACLSIAEELFTLQRKMDELQNQGVQDEQLSEISERIRQILDDIKSDF